MSSRLYFQTSAVNAALHLRPFKLSHLPLALVLEGNLMSNFTQVFRRHGLERIVPQAGEKFDPSIQEAMFEVPLAEGQEPGTVAHVVRTGWKLHDRCVRSAQVGVVKE